MKILDIELINYIRIYSRLQLERLYIDLSKGKYKVNVIKAPNGYGKSGLLEALHIMPDSNDSFRKDIEAGKNIHVIDNDNMYYIRIVHPIKSNGDRDTTKAYIEKNGLELNPNGNVGSYKEILFIEFLLDSNFLSLSKLSSEDRGLVDKVPSSRKKFVTSIISEVEVYNNILKALTERRAVFKSIQNSIIAKINTIGDEEQLSLSLESIQNRIDSLLSNKDNYLSELAVTKNKIQLLDPDGSIQTSYDNIYSGLKLINQDISDIESKIERLYTKTQCNKDNISIRYKEVKDIINQLEIDIKVSESNINSLLQSRENEAKELQRKTSKLDSLKAEYNYIDLNSMIKQSESNIKEYLDIIHSMGYEDVSHISKEEFIVGLNTVKEIKDTIDIFKSNLSESTIRLSIEYMKNNNYPNIKELEDNIERVKNDISELDIRIVKYSTLSEVAKKISDRPKDCKIDVCPYIKDGIDAYEQIKDIDIDSYHRMKDNLQNSLSQYTKQLEDSIDITTATNYLKTIVRSVEMNASIVKKLPIWSNSFCSRTSIFEAILNNKDFKEIDVLYGYIEYANIIEEYKIEKEKLDILYKDREVYESKNKILDEMMIDIDTINKNMSSISTEIDTYTQSIIENKNKLSSFRSLILEIEELLELQSKYNILLSNKSDLISKYSVIKNNISVIKECISAIQTLENNIQSIVKQISPLMKDRDKLSFALQQSKEYKTELALYKAKVERVETIRKYCNPTEEGIQLIFIDMYMNKTLSMANELLGLMFDGEYSLGQMQINGDEFRIPCMSSNMMIDDISSMSTSQKCMISMIVSFVLLYQSSSRYNILRLDEIDSGLDNYNRLRFFPTLNELMNILGIEQVFMISHNEELSLDECNIIILKDYPDVMNNINEDNIIYRAV